MWMEIVTPYSKFVFYINKKRKQNKLFKNKKVLIFSRSKSKYKKNASAFAKRWERTNQETINNT